MIKKYILYFDDTGSRDPDHKAYSNRHDSMDCFGLGGILIKEEDVDEILQKHKTFCEEWKIDYPLHSTKIRGGQEKFGWLKKPENAGAFLPELEEFLLSLPIIANACVIHRPGYLARYKKHYDQLWQMCRTAFGILVERSAKFSERENRKLEIFFESSGRKEDRDLIQYLRDLKKRGNFFDQEVSSGYTPFIGKDYSRVILGEPRRKTKSLPMIQIADLVLYPIAKGRYDPKYRPYKKLKEGGKLIDCFLTEEEIPLLGIKYSCFDD